MTKNNQFTLTDLQKNAWISEIKILKDSLELFKSGHILFEYTIPRIGKRVDNVIIHDGIVYILEFKIGAEKYSKNDIDQLIDYALDLKNFHEQSQKIKIIPLLISTNAENKSNKFISYADNIYHPILCNENTLKNELNEIKTKFRENLNINTQKWIQSPYRPTPTIIEAAQYLYQHHDVKEISRNDAGTYNLKKTTETINKIIEHSKKLNRKSICFITGVPGAGKTLAGLNIANERHDFEKEEHAIFLSGNEPLVSVLQESLARNDVSQKNEKGIKFLKKDALRKAKSFIQLIHHFRDDAIAVENEPTEKVVIFDEAQRAWDKEKTSKFMKDRKGINDFDISEPNFLIQVMDRHDKWAAIICLIGGGQEIHTGEAGLLEWFESLKSGYKHWDIYLSNNIIDSEYITKNKFNELFTNLSINIKPELHLDTSIRSFRSEKLSLFVKQLLDNDLNAKLTYDQLKKQKYIIKITRDLNSAKKEIKKIARGNERYGIIASSGAKRLRKEGIWVEKRADCVSWFLNSKNDIRSSYFLEDTCTEFDIQGLELDWSIVGWDANFRLINNEFQCYSLKGTKWQKIKKNRNKKYLKNAYRVLLTRARQGMIIFIPKGNNYDKTCLSEFYDGTYEYLKKIGIEEI